MVDFTLFKTPIKDKLFFLFSVVAVLSVSTNEKINKETLQAVTQLQDPPQPVEKQNQQQILNHSKEFVVCCSSIRNKSQSSVEKEQNSSTNKESGNRIVASANSIPFNTPTLKIPIINKTALFNAT